MTSSRYDYPSPKGGSSYRRRSHRDSYPEDWDAPRPYNPRYDDDNDFPEPYEPETYIDEFGRERKRSPPPRERSHRRSLERDRRRSPSIDSDPGKKKKLDLSSFF